MAVPHRNLGQHSSDDGQDKGGQATAHQHHIQPAHVHACKARQLQEGGDAGGDGRAIAHQGRVGPNELRFILLCPQRHTVYQGGASIAGVLPGSSALRVWCRRTEAMQTHLCRRLVGDRWWHWEWWRLRMQMLPSELQPHHTVWHDEGQTLGCQGESKKQRSHLGWVLARVLLLPYALVCRSQLSESRRNGWEIGLLP